LIGSFLPPFIAATLTSLWVISLLFFEDDFSLDSVPAYSVFYMAAYMWSGIQCTFISIFMEWIGRKLYGDNHTNTYRSTLIYIGVGTCMGGLLATALVLYDQSRVFLDFYLVPIGLISGFLMSLIMLRTWRADLQSNNE
jgi:hypothetical protein